MSPAADAPPRPPRWRRALDAARALWSRDPLTLAASVAFYTSLSFVPLLTVAVLALARLGPSREAAFLDTLQAVMGAQVTEPARALLARVDATPEGGLAGAVALGAIAFSASAVFGQLQTAINRLWGLDGLGRGGWRGWLRDRLVSFGMLIGLGMLLLSTFIASSAVGIVFAERAPLVAAAGEAASTALIATAFALLFRYVPYVRPAWRRCVPAGIATALLFQLGKWALGQYFAAAGIGDAYGPAGAVVALMTWVYYVSLLGLLGSALARPPSPASREATAR